MKREYMEKDTSYATTIIITNDAECKKYGIVSQGAEGDDTTVKFRTLKGAKAFIYDCLEPERMHVIARERNLESKAKRPVYQWVIKYDYHEYERRLLSTPLTELDEFFFHHFDYHS